MTLLIIWFRHFKQLFNRHIYFFHLVRIESFSKPKNQSINVHMKLVFVVIRFVRKFFLIILEQLSWIVFQQIFGFRIDSNFFRLLAKSLKKRVISPNSIEILIKAFGGVLTDSLN